MKAPFSRTFFDLLVEQAEKTPEQIAVVARGAPTTYAALLRRVRVVATAMLKRGLRRGDRVGGLISNRIEWLEIAFASSAVGAVFAPFSTWSTRSELEFLIADSRVLMMVSHARLADRDFAGDFAALAPELLGGGTSARFPHLREVVLIEADANSQFTNYEALAAESWQDDLAPGYAASAADDALILYTSGSSAHPKAVRLKHFGVIENGFNIGERMGFGPDDRVFLSAPLFWSYGSANALAAAMTHGATLVLQERFEPEGALELIERFGCTAIYTLPGMTKSLATHPRYDRSRLRTLRTGLTIGSPLDFLFAVEALGARELCNIYGATETYGNCCVTSHQWTVEQRSLCQGEPLPGNEIRFVDVMTGATLPSGEIGLAEVRGYVTAGYDGASADQNASAFTSDGFYRTGDVGRLDENGAFVFVGRNTEMIKRAGINVSPAEVENILLAHAGVSQAAVVGVPDTDRGELIIAFVVPAKPEVTESELLAHCRAVASKYKVPDRIEIQSTLPFTSTGKLQRRALKETAVGLLQSGGRAAHG